MAEPLNTKPADNSFKSIDLEKLDTASKEELIEIGNIVGLKSENCTPMKVKATLFAGYEAALNNELWAQGKSSDVKYEMLGAIRSQLNISEATGDIKYNDLIDLMQKGGLITPENAAEYKKPAIESLKQLAEIQKLPPAEYEEKNKKLKINPTGNFAALYDFGIDTGFIDKEKLQGYMEQSLKSTIQAKEAVPELERTDEAKAIIKQLKEYLGVEMVDPNAKKLPSDERTDQQKQEAAKGAAK